VSKAKGGSSFGKEEKTLGGREYVIKIQARVQKQKGEEGY